MSCTVTAQLLVKDLVIYLIIDITQDETIINENDYLRKRKDIDYNEGRMTKRLYGDDGYVTPLQHSPKDSLSSPSETSQYFPRCYH